MHLKVLFLLGTRHVALLIGHLHAYKAGFSWDRIKTWKLTQGGKKEGVGMILMLDIDMEAPVITMPRGSDSKDTIVVDLGSLHLGNRVTWRNGDSVDNPQV